MRWVEIDPEGLPSKSMQLKLRSALVIGKANALRRTIVQFLKNQGWLVHGMDRVELAVPILPHIPYQLIVIDSELLRSPNKEFTRPCTKPGNGERSRR